MKFFMQDYSFIRYKPHNNVTDHTVEFLQEDHKLNKAMLKIFKDHII